MIPIPSARHATVTLSGAVYKIVRCEHCQSEYVYLMERATSASDTTLPFADIWDSLGRARSNAEARLQQRLANEHDAVPCPQCGWFQSYMYPLARRAHWRGVFVLGLWGCIVGLVG